MPQHQPRKVGFSIPPPPPPPETSPLGEAAGTALRTGVGLLPAALRVGSGFAAAPFATSGVGIPLAAAIGGGGDVLAQLLELATGARERINPWETLVEAGMGGVPFARFARGPIGHALVGMGMAGGGVAGRKAVSEDPSVSSTALDPRQWGKWDLAQVAGGGILGGAVGRKATLPSPPPKGGLKGVDRFIKTAELGPEAGGDIRREAARLEAIGRPKAGRGLRLAAARRGVGDERLFKEAAEARKPPDVETTAQRLEVTGKPGEAERIRMAAFRAEEEGKATRTALLKAQKAREKKAAEAKKAADKRAHEAKKASEVASRRAGFVPKSRTATESVSTEGPTGVRTGVTTRFGPPQKSRATTPAGGALPGRPVPPKPWVYQIVTPDGKVIEAADTATAERLVNAAGRGSTVVPPSDIPVLPPTRAAAPIAPKTATATPRVAPTAAPSPIKVIAPDEVAVTIRAPEAPAAVTPPTAPGPASANLKLEGLGYTTDEIKKMSMADMDRIIKAGTLAAPKVSAAAGKRAAILAESEKGASELEKLEAVTGREIPTPPGARGTLPVKPAGMAGISERSPDDLIEDALQRIFPEDATRTLGPLSKAYSAVRVGEKLPRQRALLALQEEQDRLLKAGAVTQIQLDEFRNAALGIRRGTAPGTTPKTKGAAPIVARAAPKTPAPRTGAYVTPPVAPGGVGPFAGPRPLAVRPPPESGLPPTSPIPPPLQAKLDAAKAQQAIMQNSGRGASSEALKLGQDIDKLNIEVAKAQYPHLADEIDRAVKEAARATPKK